MKVDSSNVQRDLITALLYEDWSDKGHEGLEPRMEKMQEAGLGCDGT